VNLQRKPDLDVAGNLEETPGKRHLPGKEHGMTIIPAIFENGVLRPLAPANLPEHARVDVMIADDVLMSSGDPMNPVYDVLSRRFESGESDVAARHEDHQP
jgi:predicted DNA-binding antitoxin AbrB/MazE fold protein